MPAPFEVRTDPADLTDLRERLHRTRWTEQIADTGWEYGTDVHYLRDLCAYWADEFDWAAVERKINQWPQIVTTIDGARLHAIHARSPHPGARPLLLTHGWPGSIVEFLDVIGPLVDPPDPADAFHVVCPSLPGYAWSGPTVARGWDIRRVADALAALMTELGYDRFGAQGGDWGAFATNQLALHHADRLTGIHLNLVPARQGDLENLTPEEVEDLGVAAEFRKSGSAYAMIQGTRPQTLAHGLADSPAGLAGWIVEKFRAWSDCDGEIEKTFRRDDLLANITTYWLTGTIGSSVRLYRETMSSGDFGAPKGRIEVPTGVAVFPKEIARLPRSWVEAAYNLVHWSPQPRGGHFAAMEQPDLFVADVRTFFRALD